jgi:hypothetical protein
MRLIKTASSVVEHQAPTQPSCQDGDAGNQGREGKSDDQYHAAGDTHQVQGPWPAPLLGRSVTAAALAMA